MSIRQETPEPGEGEFWIDLPAPAAMPEPANQDTPEAPAVSGDDPGAIFAPDHGTDMSAPASDASVGEQTAAVDTAGEMPDSPAAPEPDVADEPVAGDLMAEPELVEHEPELEEEGAAAFVPVLLGGALALAIAVGLEAAGLWSTLLPP